MVTLALLSTGKDDWRTPSEVLSLVYKIDRIGLDPCADRENNVNARKYYLRDGLVMPWHGEGLVYVNPPYSQLKKWAMKASTEAELGAEIVMLVPARTDTQAFHNNLIKADALCFWRGRIKFVGGDAGAPFPSLFVYWGPRVSKFIETFSNYGFISQPNVK